MEQDNDDAGLQFVLDNRRLIVGFGLLVALCGGFFVLGFVEGRRQAGSVQEVAVPPIGTVTHPASAPVTADTRSAKGVTGPDDKTVREHLDWYSQVGGASGAKDKGREASPSEGARTSTGQTAPAANHRETPAQPVTAAAQRNVTYTVQVGAFRQRKEAEAKAAMLKEKGYDFVIEPPAAGDQLYLLKVGRFSSRADAVGLQLRLRKDGFSTFIKTN